MRGDERIRTAVPSLGTDSAYDADTLGAIGMARWWMLNPEHAHTASHDCLRRELLTISRALTRLANRAEAEFSG